MAKRQKPKTPRPTRELLCDVNVCAPEFFDAASCSPSEWQGRASAFVQAMSQLDRAVMLYLDDDGKLALASIEDTRLVESSQ